MKLKIAHLDYDIRPLKPLAADAESAQSLITHSPETAIYLRTDQPAAEQVRLLWHELIHAMWYAFNLSGEPLEEEDVCLTLESPLATVMRDNPQLAVLMANAFDGQPIAPN
jgi:hypothetical protein